MKRMTRNDLKDYNYIVLNYNQCRKLLKYFVPEGYNAGVYGHNWYFYKFPFISVIVGYRNLVGIQPTDSIIEEYEDIARLVDNNTSIPFENRKIKCRKLCTELLQNLYLKYF